MLGLVIALTTLINTRVAYNYYVEHFIGLISPVEVTNGDSLYISYIRGKNEFLQGRYEDALYNFYKVTLSGKENRFADSALFFISLIQDKLELYNESMDSRKYFMEKFRASPLISKVRFLYALNLRDLTKNYKEALKFLNLAMSGDDTDILPFIYLESGVTWFLMKNYSTALKFFEKLRSLEEPLHSYFVCIYGFTLVETGKFEEALKTIIKCHSPEIENYRNFYLARAYIHLGHPDSARVILEKLISEQNVEPDILGNAYYLLGEIRFINGDYKVSMNYYKLALQYPSPDINPDKLRYKIELCKYRLGFYRSATELNISFVKKYPDSPLAPELLYEVFFLYTVRHWEKSALNILKWLAVRYDGNAYTIQAISEGLKRGLDPQKIYKIVAGRINESYLKTNPSALLVLATLYDSLGMADSALEMYSRLITSNNPDLKYRAMLNSMNVYMKIKRYNEAILVGHQLFKLSRDEAVKFGVLKKLVKVYKQSGQAADLEKFLLTVVDQFTGDSKAKIYIQLARLRGESGDNFMAKFYLKRAYEAARSPDLKREISLEISRIP